MNPAERLFLERYVSNPKRNLLRFSFVFMVLGIVLSVGILSAALNLFEGYERALSSVLLDSFPHIRVQDANRTFMDEGRARQACALLASQPEVESATPNISFNVMASNGGKAHGCFLSASDFPPGAAVTYAKYVRSGHSKPSAGKVIVGHYLAKELGLGLGDTLRVIYPNLDKITPLGMLSGEYPFVIDGIYRSGYYEYDRTLILATVADARGILDSSAGFSSVEVKLKSPWIARAASLAAKYDKFLGGSLQADPVANTTLLKLVKMQKWLIFVIFSFLVLIAGINVISAVLTQIYDKKNEIAVMKALGAAPSTVRNILGYQMVLVCLLSIILGQAFGMALSWLAVKQNFYHLKGDVYFIDRLTLYISPLNLIITFAAASLLVLLCVRIPLRRIDRMPVIELLRNP